LSVDPAPGTRANAIGQAVDPLPDGLRLLAATNDEFLAICESVWVLSEEERELQVRAAQAREAGQEGTLSETLDRIDLNLWKRRFLLSRARDMAAGLG
jgi:hypothetical protein